MACSYPMRNRQISLTPFREMVETDVVNPNRYNGWPVGLIEVPRRQRKPLLYGLRDAIQNWSPRATFSLSPLGRRGKHRWRRLVKPQLLTTSRTGERVSLSPRERDACLPRPQPAHRSAGGRRQGVRGNRAIENPRPDVIHRNSLPAIPPKTSKNRKTVGPLPRRVRQLAKARC